MPALDDLPDPLTPDTPCEEAFRRIALHCADRYAEAADLVRDSADPRGPHKARVALRRLTSALDVFAPLLRRKRCQALRDRSKVLFRTLGDLRDSDVHLECRKAEPGHKARAARNAALRRKVRKALANDGACFPADLAALVAADGALWRRGRQARGKRATGLGGFAEQILRQVWAECRGHGDSVSAMTPEQRHDFRKDLKTMRYLAEFLEPLFPGLSQDPFRSDFRDIQDALGTLNDWEVALALEGASRPAAMPARQTRAMVAAEAIWLRLCSAPLPWV